MNYMKILSGGLMLNSTQKPPGNYPTSFRT